MSVMVSSMSAHNDGMPPTSPLTSVSSVEQLAASITASINIGVLVPGVQLSEVALAQQYGVSRNTLREAFRLLARDGLVEHVPHRGVFVRTMTAHDLKDIYAYRRFVELGAITYAYSDAHRTLDCLRRMRVACDHGEAGMLAENWIDVGNANVDFHQAIVDFVGSAFLTRNARIALAQSRLAFLVHPNGNDVHSPFVKKNRYIVNLLATGEVAAARDELSTHLDRAESINLKLVADGNEDSE